MSEGKKRDRAEDRRKERIRLHHARFAVERKRTWENFVEQIKSAMNSSGLTRAELARRLHKSRAYVTQVLDYNDNLTIRTMVELASACGLEISIHVTPKQVSK